MVLDSGIRNRPTRLMDVDRELDTKNLQRTLTEYLYSHSIRELNRQIKRNLSVQKRMLQISQRMERDRAHLDELARTLDPNSLDTIWKDDDY